MRRLEIPSKKDVFERGSKNVVRSFEISREQVQRLQKERPELVAAKEAGVMLLQPQGNRAWLSYGFESVDVLRREFRSMLEGLTKSLRADEAKSGIFLWFVDQPNRPYIEPVLADCLFELRHEWMEMALARLPEGASPADEIAPGFILGHAVAGKQEAAAAIDVAAFADNAWQMADFVGAAGRAAEFRVLKERESSRVAGYIGLWLEEGRVGKIDLLGVHADFRRRGLAEAMLRWSLAWFREQGMRRAKLAVHTDNTAAIALYRKLGFAHERSGLTYRRPTDERELAEMAQKRKGTYVKFGDWR
jgi:ribosomal protein S18 acetylase RimI-like enzyme